MVAKNIEKSWRLPRYGEPPVSDIVKGQPRPWWYHFFNHKINPDKPEKLKKCPLCKVRVVTTKSLGRGELSCGECAHLHYRSIQMEIDGVTMYKDVYLTTKDILKETAKMREQLAYSRTPGKKNH